MKRFRPIVRLALTVAGMIFFAWFGYNCATIAWIPDPTEAATSFARQFNPALPISNQWTVVKIEAQFPGPTLILQTATDEAKIIVSLQSFLGLGWQENRYESVELK